MATVEVLNEREQTVLWYKIVLGKLDSTKAEFKMIRRELFTTARMKQMQLDNQQKEFKFKDNIAVIRRDELNAFTSAAEERVENKRVLRRQQQEFRERDMQEKIERAERERILKEKQHDQETKLAKELERLKWEEQRDQRTRQQIKENSVELRELEGKLKAGYMNKERAAQLMEKEVIKKEEELIENHYAKMLREEHRKGVELDNLKEEEKHWQKLQYRDHLEDQLAEQELKQQEMYEEFLKEKLMIDEIIRKIYEEDQREAEAKLAKRRATRQYINEFLKKRDEWREHERQLMEEENRKILEFSKQQQARENQRMAIKKEQEEAMAVMQSKLGEEITSKREQADEMQRIITELYQEEQKERERQQEKQSLEDQLRQRLDLQMAHKNYLETKERMMEAQKLEEAEYRRQMMEKFAADDRIEQMNAQKRRMKQLEHRREVERLIEARRAQFVRDKETEIMERREEDKRDEERRAIIEQERQRLLHEHASKLLGYLPKGVFRGYSDVSMLGDDFKEAYKKRPMELLDDDDLY